MTQDLLLGPTRLWYANGHGLARHDEVQVVLRWRPTVLMHELHIDDLDYAPGIGVYYIQPRGRAKRDMEPGERAACLAYLQQMAQHMRAWPGPLVESIR